MIHYFKGVTQLPKLLSKAEKLLFSTLLIIALLAAGFWWRDITSAWLIKPVKGGIYTEGIVNASAQEVDQIIAKLTKVGLTYVDGKNETKGALADHWTVTDDGKKYTFFLRPGVAAANIADTYANLPNWQNITITAENNTVVMVLKQPFSLLLAFTSEPVVDSGPYLIEKQTKSEIIFASNKNFVLGEPNIERVILSFYPDNRSLLAALQRQEIMGADNPFKNISGTRIEKMRLTKQTALFFNLEKPLFKDKILRQKIKNNEHLDTPIEATLVTTQEPTFLDLANKFAEKAKKIGLTVSIRSVNQIVLDRDIIPNDGYDLLLTDINYGYDQDPYPFWHSSQLIPPGKNYSGYNSKEADSLIEEARQLLDPAERNKKYEAFQKILAADTPAIFYPNKTFDYTVSTRLKGRVEGIGAVPADRFTEVWKWYIKAKKQKTS